MVNDIDIQKKKKNTDIAMIKHSSGTHIAISFFFLIFFKLRLVVLPALVLQFLDVLLALILQFLDVLLALIP